MDEYAFYCPRCQFGRCRPGKATYTRLYRGSLITAPDTTVYVCDVCAYQEFDQAALRDLHLLMGREEYPADEVQPLPKTPPFESQDANDTRQPKP